ncbi:LytR/AlgR family response regulator transcription factor [Flavobacterium chuncheonense]|uniref:LytR/AlgR family response regulator transcription factor n=1 Tax=Flavobacterium chuncheonense TaxID=2026653 RepID=A0ABW5YJN1_9FLAO
MKERNLNFLIVEDEYITQKSIEKNLNALGHHVLGRAMDYEKAVSILTNEKIDFAIIDINIRGDKSGIDLGAYIANHIKIPFIYLTAYADKKTISSAINTEPYGYIVKPFQQHDIVTSIEIALLNFKKENINTNEDFIIIKHSDKNIKLNLDAILFIESDKNYLNIFTKKGIYKYRNTLQEFSKILPSNFIQTHKSFFINTDKITTISKTTLEIDEYKIPISTSYKNSLKEFL